MYINVSCVYSLSSRRPQSSRRLHKYLILLTSTYPSDFAAVTGESGLCSIFRSCLSSTKVIVPRATEKCHFFRLTSGPIILHPQTQSHHLSLLRLSQQDRNVTQTFHAEFSGATAAVHLNAVCLTPFLCIFMQN